MDILERANQPIPPTVRLLIDRKCLRHTHTNLDFFSLFFSSQSFAHSPVGVAAAAAAAAVGEEEAAEVVVEAAAEVAPVAVAAVAHGTEVKTIGSITTTILTARCDVHQCTVHVEFPLCSIRSFGTASSTVRDERAFDVVTK